MQQVEIEPGIYDAPHVQSHRLERLPTGTQALRIIFRVIYAGDQHYSDVEAMLWFSDKAVDRSLDALEYLGWTGSDIMELAHGDANSGTCLLDGSNASIDVKRETYKDQEQVRVAFVNKIGGSDFEADSINARLLARRRESGSPMPAARPAATAAPSPAAAPAARPAPPAPPAPTVPKGSAPF